jgi:hypothetical protein
VKPLEIWEQWRRVGSEALLLCGSALMLIAANQADIAAMFPSKKVGAFLLVCGFLDRLYVKWREMKKDGTL